MEITFEDLNLNNVSSSLAWSGAHDPSGRSFSGIQDGYIDFYFNKPVIYASEALWKEDGKSLGKKTSLLCTWKPDEWNG